MARRAEPPANFIVANPETPDASQPGRSGHAVPVLQIPLPTGRRTEKVG